MKPKKLTAILLILAFLTAAGCAAVPNAPINAAAPTAAQDALILYNFTCEQHAMLVGTRQEGVLCTVSASRPSGNVFLCFNDEPIAPMNDAGLEGDVTAGDGVYSCRIDVEADSYAETVRLDARAGLARSETANIYIVTMPAGRQLNQMKEVMKTLGSLTRQHANAPAQQLDAAEKYVKKLVKNGIALEYARGEENVETVLSSGLKLVFQPTTPLTLSMGGGAAVEIYTFEPFYSQLNATKVDDSAESVSRAFANFGFSSSANYDDGAVTRAAVSGFGENQLILWRGHGGFSASDHAFLITGETIDEKRMKSDASYYNELIADGLLVMTDGRIAFSAKYVKKHCGSLKNSVFFLSACKSGRNGALADAFLRKGAAAAFGYTDTVSSYYADRLESAAFGSWTQIDPATGNYYTLSGALDAAKAVCGADDSGYTIKTSVAAPVLFGDGALRLADNGAGGEAPAAADTPDEGAYAAYRRILKTNSWINDCPSDLSELSPADYAEVWLGDYTLFDMDGDGTDEMVIRAGQSMADMSCTFYTYTGGAARLAGALMCGEVSFYRNESGNLALEYTRGETCEETHLSLIGGALIVTGTERRAAAQIPASRAYLAVHSVHDLAPLGG